MRAARNRFRRDRDRRTVHRAVLDQNGKGNPKTQRYSVYNSGHCTIQPTDLASYARWHRSRGGTRWVMRDDQPAKRERSSSSYQGVEVALLVASSKTANHFTTSVHLHV